MNISVTMPGAEKLIETWKKAPNLFTKGVARLMNRVLEEGVTTIKIKYRSGPATTPRTTRAPTGNLKSSYSQKTRILSIGSVEGHYGGLADAEVGEALTYMKVHEFGASVPLFGNRERMVHIPARPPGGAIRITARVAYDKIHKGLPAIARAAARSGANG